LQSNKGKISGTTWTIPLLEKGQTAQLTEISSFTSNGKKTNVAKILRSSTPDPVLFNNSATASVTIVNKPLKAPVVSAISPAHGEAGQVIRKMVITGDNFQRKVSVTLERTGQADIIPTDIVFNNPGRITCTLPIPKTADTGLWNVTVTNQDGQSGTKADAFRVTAPEAPVVKSINPHSGTSGTSLFAFIRGQNFQNGMAVKLQMSSQPDIPADKIFWFGDQGLVTAKFTIPDSAEPGTWDISVTNPDGQSGILKNAYTISAAKSPTINQISPAQAKAGDSSVTIIVDGSDFIPGANVKFQKAGQSDIVAQSTKVSGKTRITAKFSIPSDTAAGAWDVIVTNPDGKSAVKPLAFTIQTAKKPVPTVTEKRVIPTYTKNPHKAVNPS
jgi:hypothetical protein